MAKRLEKVLLGRTIDAAYSGIVEVDEGRVPARGAQEPEATSTAAQRGCAVVNRVRGATVTEVRALGKNLLVAFSSGVTLHAHLRMHGRVSVYARRAEASPRRPESVRLVLSTADVDVVFADVPTLRLLRTDRVAKDPKLSQVGPNPLEAGSFDLDRVCMAMAERKRSSIAEVLLDQRVMAGIGNVLKSETLFLAGADPFATIELYDDDMLRSIATIGAELLRMTTDPRVARYGGRVTRLTEGSMRGRGSKLWVYERSGRECFVCGSTIRRVMQRPAEGEDPNPRSTYFCPSCQPTRRSVEEPLERPPIRVGHVSGRHT